MQPFREPSWETIYREFKLQELKKLKDLYSPSLNKKPWDPSKITVLFSYTNPVAKGFRRYLECPDLAIDYKLKGNKPHVFIPINVVARRLEEDGATDDSIITIEIVYPVE